MQESILNTKSFSIKEVSSIIGISTQTLRNWEVFFNLEIERNEFGQRIYTENSLAILKKINHHAQRGLKLKAIKELINGYFNPQSNIEVITEKEENTQNFELAIINKYETRIQELNNKINNLQAGLNREIGQLQGELKKYDEIVILKDQVITDLKDRLTTLEQTKARKWWQIWK